MGVYIKYTSYDYTQTQGPAPSGYHVPLKDEWVALCGILTSTFGMASNASTLKTYLKMPLAGNRSSANSNISNQGTYGHYWSVSCNLGNSSYSYDLLFSSSSLNPQNSAAGRTAGMSIRCFKNSPSIPDSNRTVLYQGTGSAGIYHNSSLGLISISGDGINWTTIQDKNLGATTVYNDGNTLSEANCGKYYQRGNNYGFPRTGSVTTSTTQVDASNYGPGNYYSSSTYIYRSTSPYRWDTTNNQNLWGGVTGVSPMSELKNAYIGEVWTPGSNTVAYYQLEKDGNDYSGNGHNLTWYGGTPTYTISGGTKKVVNLNGSILGKIANLSGTYTNYTFNVWCKPTNNTTTWQELFDNTKSPIDSVYINFNGTSNEKASAKDFAYQYRPNGGTNTYQYVYGTTNRTANTWYNVVITSTSSGIKIYVNGTQIASNSTTGAIVLDSGYNFIGGRYNNNTQAYNNRFIGYMSEFIMEDKSRTASEVANYYNSTKANYGIS